MCVIAGCTFYSRMSCRESLGSRQNLLSLQLIGMYLVLIFKLANHVIEISEETKEILPYINFRNLFCLPLFCLSELGVEEDEESKLKLVLEISPHYISLANPAWP